MFPIGKTDGYSKNDGESVKFFIFAFELEEWSRLVLTLKASFEMTFASHP